MRPLRTTTGIGRRRPAGLAAGGAGGVVPAQPLRAGCRRRNCDHMLGRGEAPHSRIHWRVEYCRWTLKPVITSRNGPKSTDDAAIHGTEVFTQEHVNTFA